MCVKFVVTFMILLLEIPTMALLRELLLRIFRIPGIALTAVPARMNLRSKAELFEPECSSV